MTRTIVFISVLCLAVAARAAWYWPFGSSGDDDKPRISELLEPVTAIIDQAAEDSEAGRTDEAVAGFRRALAELDRIEIENPDRVESAEFTTVRKKRAYVNAAIDSIIFKQAKENAKPVSVSDTTDLQKRYDRLKAKKLEEAAESAGASGAGADGAAKPKKKKKKKSERASEEERAKNLKAAQECFAVGDYDNAKDHIWKVLEAKPNDVAALNLRAAIETETGDLKAAEWTLNQAMRSNPKSYYSYLNMARLILMTRGEDGKFAASRYYDTALALGAPADEKLAEAVKETEKPAEGDEEAEGDGEDEESGADAGSADAGNDAGANEAGANASGANGEDAEQK